MEVDGPSPCSHKPLLIPYFLFYALFFAQAPRTMNNTKKDIWIPEFEPECWRMQEKYSTMKQNTPFTLLITSRSYQWFVDYGSRPVQRIITIDRVKTTADEWEECPRH
jgi:hypothetical protein